MLAYALERGGGRPSSFRPAAAAGAVALIAAVLLVVLFAGAAYAQSPSPGLLPPTDPRSEGSGPGLDSGPLLAAATVIALGLLAALATLAYSRLVRRQ